MSFLFFLVSRIQYPVSAKQMKKSKNRSKNFQGATDESNT